MGNNEKLLSVKGLTKAFHIGGVLTGAELIAVNEAYFEMQSDTPEIFTLAGESGSGKTTTARLFLHAIEPTEGHISYGGSDVTKITGRK